MKNASYNDFWQKIHGQAKENHVPLRVMFELTYKCNFNCRHCYVPKTWRKRKELNTAGIFAVITALKSAGCFYLGFTGGEIFARADIWEILQFSRRQGFQIILYTNGSLITKQSAKHIADIGVNKVDITLPGMSPKVFEAVTQVKGSHRAVFSAIDFLRQANVDLGFKTCLLSANQMDIKAIEDFCASLGCSHRLDDMPSRRLDGSRAPCRYGIENVVKVSDNIKAVSSYKCGAGASQCAITPQGAIKLCPLVDWPKISTCKGKKFYQVWEKLPAMIEQDHDYQGCPCVGGG